MINETEFNTILVNIVELFQKNCKIAAQKKSFFAVKNIFPIDQSALFINISNKTNFDLYITLTDQLKEKMIEKSNIRKPEISIEDKNKILIDLCSDFKNELQKLFNISNSNNKTSIKISQINYLEKIDEIRYETILVLQLGTEISDIFIILCFNKIKFDPLFLSFFMVLQVI